jgi:prepilin signal peptidase PulO-like enzyme (type II secretory pathway)
MDAFLAVAGALVAGTLMWLTTGVQHHLYTRPEQRHHGDDGARRIARRAGIITSAAACAGLALRPDHYDPLPALATAVATFVLLVAASTDLERRLIPNRITYALAAFAVAVCWVWPDRSVAQVGIGALAAVGLAVALFVFGEVVRALVHVRTTVFGLGDVKLIVVMGLLLGWPAIGTALLIGVIAAGVPGIVLTLAGQGRRVFPYGPFLILGALVPLLWPANFV